MVFEKSIGRRMAEITTSSSAAVRGEVDERQNVERVRENKLGSMPNAKNKKSARAASRYC